MTKQELLERIIKKEAQIEKNNKKLRAMEANLEDCDMCDLRMARYNQEEYAKQLAKYQEQLAKMNEEKVQIIVDFLNNWKKESYNWYLENAKEYARLWNNYQEELDRAYEEEVKFAAKRGYEPEEKRHFEFYSFRRSYFSHINTLTKELTTRDGVVDTARLQDLLDKEVESKYQKLVAQVKKVVGEIQDAAALRIGVDGEINGTITGTNGACKVNTITAGGYNVQCFHYRVLVKKIK